MNDQQQQVSTPSEATSAEPTPLTTPFHVLLTEREKQVAVELALGKTNKEIAGKLDVSIKTIDTHRGHIMKKLELRNNVELARMLLRDAVVTL